MEKCVVLICPGGAYCHLSPRESEPVARAFERIGARAEILSYSVRSSPEQPPLALTPVHELSDRIRELRAAQPGAKVVVCGFSAGAHLAATLGVHAAQLNLERPDALILSYPVITADSRYINEDSFLNLTGRENREFFSLEKHVGENTPPVFLWHTAGDRDVPVENSLLFARALSSAHIPFELHIYPFGEHGLSLATDEVRQDEKGRLPDKHVAGWINECAAWLHTMSLL